MTSTKKRLTHNTENESTDACVWGRGPQGVEGVKAKQPMGCKRDSGIYGTTRGTQPIFYMLCNCKWKVTSKIV